MSIMFKSIPMEVKQRNNGNLIFKISTNIPDRDEDILEPQGVMLENYRKNSVVLFAHDYSSLPVGKSVSEKIYTDYIESEVEFAPTAFAQDCKKLCEGGFLKAASVGFIGLESEPIDGSKYGKRYKKWELLEWSIVPVPSNAASLIQNAKSKGVNLDAMEKELQDLEIKSTITKPGWDETETSFRFRVRDPGLFQEGSFRTVPIKKDKPRVNSVMGRLKDETTLTVQSIIFPKEDDWDLAGAKAWLKEHEDLTKGGDNIKNKSTEIKKLDLEGNPSVYDIFDAIRLAINSAGIYTIDRPYIEDLYPIKYPNGHVIIEKNEKYFLYQYEYKDKIAILSTDFIELEELYKPKGYFIKSGATLSQKTKNMLGEICESMNNCSDKLRKFIENTGIDEPPDESGKTNDIGEMKQALAEIKSQVLILCEKTDIKIIANEIFDLQKKDANKDINLDAIEFPKPEKDAAQDKLEIKPEELKQLITEIINNQIKGGN